MNIVLIGYRGSGKTSVGAELARRLGRELVDTDALVERKAGKTIREIFAEFGEPAFRDRESEAVAEAASRTDRVIATGGGAVLRSANVDALRASGKLVWLRCGAEELHRRIHADPTTGQRRPNLTALGGGLEEIERLLTVRTPVYQSAADSIVDVADRGVASIADEVLLRLGFEPRAGDPE